MNNLTGIDRGFVFVEVRIAVLLIAKINGVSTSIAESTYSSRGFASIETTFMLEIRSMSCINQD